jgi:hypothetical protein
MRCSPCHGLGGDIEAGALMTSNDKALQAESLFAELKRQNALPLVKEKHE